MTGLEPAESGFQIAVRTLLGTFPAISSLADIIEFHVQFERIRPFQDGNGRVGRLIMFKECLKHNKLLMISIKFNMIMKERERYKIGKSEDVSLSCYI